MKRERMADVTPPVAPPKGMVSGSFNPPLAQVLDVEVKVNTGAPDPAAYTFLELADVIAVSDSRGNEAYTDRRLTVGRPVSSFGNNVASIRRAADGWFDVEVDGGKVYRVPVTNVRSARR